MKYVIPPLAVMVQREIQDAVGGADADNAAKYGECRHKVHYCRSR
jgi:hypothetical protein